MLRQTVGLASRVAGPSRQAVLARRTFAATPHIYRQDRRQSLSQFPLARHICLSIATWRGWLTTLVPQGHVRARRVSRPVPISSGSSHDGPTGMGGQLPIEDSMPYYPDIPTRAAVHVPPDPKGVLTSGHGVRDLLANDTLIIVRRVPSKMR